MGVYVSSRTVTCKALEVFVESVENLLCLVYPAFLNNVKQFPGLSVSQSQVYARTYCYLRSGPLCLVHVHVEIDECLQFWPQG